MSKNTKRALTPSEKASERFEAELTLAKLRAESPVYQKLVEQQAENKADRAERIKLAVSSKYRHQRARSAWRDKLAAARQVLSASHDELTAVVEADILLAETRKDVEAEYSAAREAAEAEAKAAEAEAAAQAPQEGPEAVPEAVQTSETSGTDMVC